MRGNQQVTPTITLSSEGNNLNLWPYEHCRRLQVGSERLPRSQGLIISTIDRTAVILSLCLALAGHAQAADAAKPESDSSGQEAAQHSKTRAPDADRANEVFPIPDGIHIRIRPLSNRGKRGAPAHWDCTRYNAQQILAMIADFQPSVLERYTDGRLDAEAPVPVAPGQPPMNVRQFLNASIKAGAPGCIITPRLSLEEFDKGTLFSTAQNLYDFLLDPPMRILSLDNWGSFAPSHKPEQIRAMFKKLQAQGWKHIAVNMVGGMHDAQGFAAIAEFGIKRERGFAPNLEKLQRMRADPSIKKHLLYIDFPKQANDFMKLTPDERAEALVNRIAALQQKEGFTFVWPVLQGPWDSTRIFTTPEGPWHGAPLYQVMKDAAQKYPRPAGGPVLPE